MNYMIQHYLKTAIRNLLKYKTHSIISAICLSVGMTCFSIIHFFINEIDGASRNMPNFEQRISIRMINSNHEVGGWGWSLNSSEIRTLTEHPIPGIKQICFHSYQREAEVVFINREQEEKPYIISYMDTDPNFFSHYNASFLYGNALPTTPEEVVLSESCARKVYGKSNPVGTLLKIVKLKESEKDKSTYYKVVNVIRNLPKTLNVETDIYFSHLREENRQQGYITEGTLETADGLNKANESLKGMTTLHNNEMAYFIANKEADSYHDPQRMIGIAFITFLSSLILLSGMINFLKFIIQSFYNRNRELALRKSLGASPKSLFALLFTEAFWMLTFSLLLSLVLSECTCLLLTTYIPPKEMIPIDIQTLYGIQVKLYIGLLLICTLVMLYPIRRLQRSGLAGHMKTNSHRHLFRNIMMCVQLCVCIFFLGMSIAIHLFNSVGSVLYLPLSDKETNSTLCLEMNSVTLGKNKDAILSQIKMLPGVENISSVLMSGNYNSFLTSDYESADHRTLTIRVRQGDPSYFQFFRIPFRGEIVEPHTSNVVYISEAFQKQLENDSVSGNVKLGKENYRIAGTYKACYGENISEHNQYNISVFFPTEEASVIYIRFRDDISFGKAKSEIERVCRNYVPESLPLDIQRLDIRRSTTQGIRDLMGDASLLLGIISALLVILSIYSAISMDTVSRQKEVAIRKINGATPKVIALMFGKAYIIQFILAYTITYPLLRLLVIDITKDSPISSITGFTWGIYLFILIGLLIFVTTAYKIYRIMHLNPAEIIKNE